MLEQHVFHPFELAFCGYSGSGKTTLIGNIIGALAPQYEIGFIKHTAHNFDMDKTEKDTWKAMHAGAHEIFIHNDKNWAQIGTGEPSFIDMKNRILNLDFVLAEGHKNTRLPKLIVLGDGKSRADILADYAADKISNVLGFVGVDSHPDFETKLPYFQRDQTEDISEFVINFYTELHSSIPLYGLVLSGGKSSRMGSDKGAIEYHGTPHSEYLANELNAICDQTFLSCRKDQAHALHLQNFDQIHDSFPEIGPMGGILSAFQKHPDATWLVLACDLPFVDKKMLLELKQHRNPFRTATCFINPDNGWAEPLCTIYERKAFIKLLQFFSHGYTSPRKALMNSPINTIISKNIAGLSNVNTPDDYRAAKDKL